MKKKALSIYIVGLLHLGVASTIKGLPIVGFLILIGFGFYKFGLFKLNFKRKYFTKKFVIFLLGVSLSLGTFFADSGLRKKYKILNNAEIQLYCIYKMPYRSYSTDCQHEYQNLKMYEKTQEVTSNYLSFISSRKGYQLIRETAISYFRYGLDMFVFSKISLLSLGFKLSFNR